MIEAITTHFPERILANEELAQLFEGWSADKIYQKTGIKERRIAGPDETASDLAFAAAEKLLADHSRQEVDFLLFCTESPDFFLPPGACLLQARLGLRRSCGALDFNLGCSGYIYGLALGQSLILAKHAQQVLLLNADTYSRYMHPQDRNTRTVFGDGAAATLLTADSSRNLHSFVFGTDGTGGDQIIVRGGGLRCSRQPPAPNSVPQPEAQSVKDSLFMNGPEVFNFTLQAVPTLVKDVLAKAGLRFDEIDYFVFHQANAFMLDHLRRKLKIPEPKFALCLEQIGNTVSVTIPAALQMELEKGTIRPGMKILLAGFGVGLSWGGCILEWNS